MLRFECPPGCLTSQPRAESVVIAVEQSVQDAREDGDVVV